MSEPTNRFRETRWADASFSKNYLDHSAGFIPDRQRSLDLLAFLAGLSFPADVAVRCLDLGCGDGILTARLLQAFPSLRAVLVDGSEEMLGAARERFGGVPSCSFAHCSFQELMANDPLEGPFDLIVSSLAIHHLDTSGKASFYGYILGKLAAGGRFINSDVVLAPTPALETAYMELWREWIGANSAVSSNPSLLDVPDEYKSNPDNQPDTLLDQLRMLEGAGFAEVDCYAKFGIFAVFGGTRA